MTVAALCAPARCREVDPDAWHSSNAEDIQAAKAICNRCEVREDCLEIALAFPDEDQWGVWGGLTAGARRALRAADPDRWPVRTLTLQDYLGSRGERYDDGRTTPNQYRSDGGQLRTHWGEYDGLQRPPVDWAADAFESNVAALMERYGNETETGYGLTADGGTVYLVNDIEFAA